MPSQPPPPSPTHLLRSHAAPVNAVHFSDDNERLYSGDASGLVVVTSTRTLRALASWKAHVDGILGVQEWNEQILTHGRDNKLHVWERIQDSYPMLGDSAVGLDLPTPKLCYSMDVNALNYCRFSLLPVTDESTSKQSALIALPNLVESSLADIWQLPERQRLHAAIGKAGATSAAVDGRGPNSIEGIIMSMHLFLMPHPHLSERSQLRLMCAYENGSVTMWANTRTDKETSVEGVGWDSLWSAKLHVESVMAMAVSKDNRIALTVSADHLIGQYDIQAAENLELKDTACKPHRTKVPGNGAVAIRDDGKVCAVGGWDGKIRLYSVKTLKPLGTLDYHKKNCQSLAFARSSSLRSGAAGTTSRSAEDSEDEMTDEEKEERCRWLAAGGYDHRVSIWALIDFQSKS
ncbi:WD-40 repeat-containing protein [Obba rivulosa]|uniref:ASTRA-associated protein 1 n=1 Tax=Obba rivulosa TaxID=1052685 RepID=A0A8E2J4H4_9APHY|nr:WD-40 repeat-containing protein [Obba rivulosa]